jgi:hypothetical protein
MLQKVRLEISDFLELLVRTMDKAQ